MSIITELEERGFIHSITDRSALEALLDAERVTFYCGFDPTADSLHVGSLLPLILMRRLAQRGHKALVLLGSATGMIGDPSGRSEERNLLTQEQIELNIAGIRPQTERIVGLGCDVVSNMDWLGKYSMIDFLRDIGKNFSVNALLARDSVKTRLENREQGISYTEFSYALLQACDFLWLYENRGCRLQVGGSDQWGNIVSGTDLIRRKHPEGLPAFGLTIPLLLASSGTKFGKTAQGAVWLDPKRTSPYRFYQYWLNTADDDVIRLLKLFTELSLEEVATLKDSLETAPDRREAQKRLAKEVTTLVHGAVETERAEQASQALFGGDIRGLAKDTLEDVFSEVPSVRLAPAELFSGTTVTDLLVRAGAAKSKGEARRLIEGGGCYLNSEKIDSANHNPTQEDLLHGSLLVLRSGKKNYFLIRVS